MKKTVQSITEKITFEEGDIFLSTDIINGSKANIKIYRKNIHHQLEGISCFTKNNVDQLIVTLAALSRNLHD